MIQQAKEEDVKKKQTVAVRKEDLPKYLLDEKSRLVQSAVSQGYPREEVEHTVEEGLPSMEVELLVDILTNGERGVGGPFSHALKHAATIGGSVVDLTRVGAGSKKAGSGGQQQTRLEGCPMTRTTAAAASRLIRERGGSPGNL